MELCEKQKPDRGGGRLELVCQLSGQYVDAVSKVTLVEVADSVVTLHTELGSDDTGKAEARILCDEIQAADVADFTPGHRILDQSDSVLLTCPTRAELDRPPGAK